jgi:iron complex transport system ATP-binding protein
LRAGERELVRALSLCVQDGERWVVLGPNGAGKSTLLAALAGVRAAYRGEVHLEGRRLHDWTVEKMAEQRALVTDRWHDPFSASVLDTVLTARFRLGGADAEGERVAREWLAEFDCATLVDHDVATLSRGERQRVALATALAQDTPLVLLDEPIAHQDPRHQALVLDRLARTPGRTLIASLHDMNAAARFASHALLLTGRGDWSAGTAHEMLTAPRLSTLFEADVITVPAPNGAPLFSIGS